MLKKMVILGVIGFVAVAALKNTKFGSYVRSEVDGIRERAEAAIPPEKEIVRLRSELAQLDKDVMVAVSHVAKERVEVRNLEAKVTELTNKQASNKAGIESRAAAIKTAEGYVTFDGRRLSVETAKAELEVDVNTFVSTQKSLEALESTLANRIKVRDALEKQLDELKAQKVALGAAVDAAEAELNQLKLAQMQSKYQTDGTRLAKIKEDLQALNNKVAVEREKLNLMPKVHDKGTVTSGGNKSVDDITAPLRDKKPDAPKTGTQSKAD